MQHTIINTTKVLFLAFIILFSFSCERIIDVEYDYSYDFMHHFPEAKIFPPDAHDYLGTSDRHVYVEYEWWIAGEIRDALVTEARPGKSSASYYLPADRRGNRLYFGYGKAWGKATGAIVVEPLSKPNPDPDVWARRDTVFIVSLSPMQRTEDGQWFDNKWVDLSAYDGIDINIVFEADSEEGWNRFGWSTPVLRY